MRVKRLEYGDERGEYSEDFNSFKIYEVWSEPVVKSHESLPVNTTIYESPSESPVDEKRLVVAVEFPMSYGSYFFIETPEPNPGWLEKVFDLLKEKGWQGHAFEDIRNQCRGQITVIRREGYTAVIDRKKQKVYHNYEKPKGSGEKTDLGVFRPE
jgi:hypothetical protein